MALAEEEGVRDLAEVAAGGTDAGQLVSLVGHEEDMVTHVLEQDSQQKKSWMSSETKLRFSSSN
jgi:hypothetical protein